jgi:hypothetical protein
VSGIAHLQGAGERSAPSSGAGGVGEAAGRRLCVDGWASVSWRAAAPVVLCRLCERQTKSGGLNGRPEKLQDVGGGGRGMQWAAAWLTDPACRRVLAWQPGPAVVWVSAGEPSPGVARTTAVAGRRPEGDGPHERCAGVLLLVVHVMPVHSGAPALDRPAGADALHPGLPGVRCAGRPWSTGGGRPVDQAGCYCSSTTVQRSAVQRSAAC